MNTPQQHFSIADYLDVTEFILTEHNPDESEESSMPTIQIVVEVSYFLQGESRLASPLPFLIYFLDSGQLRCDARQPPHIN